MIFVVFCNCFHLIYKKEVKIVGNNSLFVCLFGRGLGQALLGRVFWVFCMFVCSYFLIHKTGSMYLIINI